jgi:Fe-S-cluster containining protein
MLERLQNIYDTIPTITCHHCHTCCKPIIWFYPEDQKITEYLKKHNRKKRIWTEKEFQQHNNLCPYLDIHGCSIYPVRPLVCRLQGLIPELPCKYPQTNILTQKKLKKILQEFKDLLIDCGQLHIFYSTRKYEKISDFNFSLLDQW